MKCVFLFGICIRAKSKFIHSYNFYNGIRTCKLANCNGQLILHDDKDVVFCLYCGTSIIVRDAIKIIHSEDPSKIINFIKLGGDASRSFNFQEAIYYFITILEIHYSNINEKCKINSPHSRKIKR